ncbi:DnaJ domain-containing protein [Roseivirga sp. BDSF3-8]|uniref:J domain-containing protein n=1 Tax=Roseivirga sp. BDSF3-8 TaxID=3241598 RepID=UPI003531E63E
MKENHYDILGLTPKANEHAIKKAYRSLARKHHPDVNSGSEEAEERFKKITAAYYVLSDPAKRLIYDLQLLNELVQTDTPLRREKQRHHTNYRRRHHSYHKPKTPHGTTQRYNHFVVWAIVLGVMTITFLFVQALLSYQNEMAYKKAIIERKNGKPEQALRTLIQMEENSSGLKASQYLLAARISLYDLNDIPLAGSFATKGVAAEPDQKERSDLLFIRAKNEMFEGRISDSYQTFEYAYNKGGGPDSALYAMAEIKTLIQKDYFTGLTLADELLKKSSGFHHALFLKAYGYYKLNDLDEAHTFINLFLERVPRSGIGYYLSARIMSARSDDTGTVCNLLKKAAENGYKVVDSDLSLSHNCP